ncbi:MULTISPECIES: helix-turn-helix domain-containing protein [unclassified Streptomyces]|uniref:helix-turn-helix domain-containing protein n=1 Tax=unclassified Streptomyces TaxID=2593676 RepID=UPI00300AC81D
MSGDQGGGGEPSGRERLAAEMRRLKQESGLSFGRLADRTHYSRSSWERFLNGKQLPTSVALQEFAAVMEADAEYLTGLLEQATGAGDFGDETAVDESPPEARPPAGAPATATTTDDENAPAGTSADKAPADDTTVDGPPPEPASESESEPAPADRDGKDTTRTWRTNLRRAGLVATGALAGSLVTVAVLTGVQATSRSGGTDSASSGENLTQHSPKPPRAGCSHDTCLRRDPQAMDCQWDATTARETWLRGMHIELRYSRACGSVWGRIENGAVGDSVTIKDKYDLQQSATIRVDRDTYTSMLAVTDEAPPTTVTICGTIPKYHAMECSPEGSIQP